MQYVLVGDWNWTENYFDVLGWCAVTSLEVIQTTLCKGHLKTCLTLILLGKQNHFRSHIGGIHIVDEGLWWVLGGSEWKLNVSRTKINWHLLVTNHFRVPNHSIYHLESRWRNWNALGFIMVPLLIASFFGKWPFTRSVVKPHQPCEPLPNQPLQPTQLHSGENSSRGWGPSTSVFGRFEVFNKAWGKMMNLMKGP